MSDDHDKSADTGYIRIPTALLVAVIGAGPLFGGGVYGITRSANNDQLPGIAQDLSDVRATANTALALAGQNSQRTNDNRQLILDNTRSRYSAEDAYRDWKKQAERDEQHERRLMLLERDVDKMQGRSVLRDIRAEK